MFKLKSSNSKLWINLYILRKIYGNITIIKMLEDKNG